jgi:predicted nucleic acid-binding protein
MYICRKRVDINIIEKFLLDYKILSLSEEDVKWAMTNRRNADFEDALQIAIAIRNGCTEFITLDRELYEAYKNLPTLKLRLL